MTYDVDAAIGRMRLDDNHPWVRRLLAVVAHAEPTPGTLTRAELRVVSAISHGLTEEMAADTLGIGFETVKYHTKNARRRVGAKNAAHLCCIALREGWIS
jgi:DNA-binding NarL/FixJ family response regulator